MYVLQVIDLDLDDTSGNNILSFEFTTSGDALLQHFVIDTWTGVITTNHAIDREFKSRYSLIISVQDNPISAFDSPCIRTVAFEIDIIDLNDNDPVCNFNETTIPLLEDKFEFGDVFGGDVLIIDIANSCFDIDFGKYYDRYNLFVLHTHHTGLNALLTYTILSGNIGAVFSLNSSSGELVQINFLDRETRDRYYLEIEVADNGIVFARSIVFTLTFLIMDINDNNPVITPEISATSVSELASLDTVLLEFSLLDRDIFQNSRILLSVDSPIFGILQDNISGLLLFTFLFMVCLIFDYPV